MALGRRHARHQWSRAIPHLRAGGPVHGQADGHERLGLGVRQQILRGELMRNRTPTGLVIALIIGLLLPASVLAAAPTANDDLDVAVVEDTETTASTCWTTTPQRRPAGWSSPAWVADPAAWHGHEQRGRRELPARPERRRFGQLHVRGHERRTAATTQRPSRSTIVRRRRSARRRRRRCLGRRRHAEDHQRPIERQRPGRHRSSSPGRPTARRVRDDHGRRHDVTYLPGSNADRRRHVHLHDHGGRRDGRRRRSMSPSTRQRSAGGASTTTSRSTRTTRRTSMSSTTTTTSMATV